jgi:hypothetical protein
MNSLFGLNYDFLDSDDAYDFEARSYPVHLLILKILIQTNLFRIPFVENKFLVLRRWWENYATPSGLDGGGTSFFSINMSPLQGF